MSLIFGPVFQEGEVRQFKARGEDLDRLMPEEMEKAIREMLRDAEVIELLKKLSDEGAPPAR